LFQLSLRWCRWCYTSSGCRYVKNVSLSNILSLLSLRPISSQSNLMRSMYFNMNWVLFSNVTSSLLYWCFCTKRVVSLHVNFMHIKVSPLFLLNCFYHLHEWNKANINATVIPEIWNLMKMCRKLIAPFWNPYTKCTKKHTLDDEL